MHVPFQRASSLALCVLLLSACGGQSVKDTLGLEHAAPDEYRVVSRPPLSVPPDFNLRPPASGESELPTTPADRIARSAVTGNELSTAGTADTAVTPVESAPAPTPADAKFLSNAGAEQSDPLIRDKVYQDKITDRKQEEEWYNKLNPLKKKQEVLDPKKEAERLKKEDVPVKPPMPEGMTPERAEPPPPPPPPSSDLPE